MDYQVWEGQRTTRIVRGNGGLCEKCFFASNRGGIAGLQIGHNNVIVYEE